jgi:hypothetical protein
VQPDDGPSSDGGPFLTRLQQAADDGFLVDSGSLSEGAQCGDGAFATQLVRVLLGHTDQVGDRARVLISLSEGEGGGLDNGGDRIGEQGAKVDVEVGNGYVDCPGSDDSRGVMKSDGDL